MSANRGPAFQDVPVPASAWLEVDLAAFRGNVARLRANTGTDVLVVVKSNAYGHGLVRISEAAFEAGARMVGVAQVAEGLALREAGVCGRVLVLGHSSPDEAEAALATNLELTAWQPERLRAYSRLARAAGLRARVHLDVDSGMGRAGATPSEIADLAQLIRSLPGIELVGLSTHFAAADHEELAHAREQLRVFRDVLAALQAAGLRPPLVHAANSAAAARLPGARFDLTRIGIHAYGVPFGHVEDQHELLAPVLAWKAQLVATKTLPPRHAVGYGLRYVTRGVERVGLVPVGYADGFRCVPLDARHRPQPGFAANEVLVRGHRVPVLGQVCMDQFVVGLGAVPDAAEGDEVVLLGRQGEHGIDVTELARRWNGSVHDAICSIMPRSPRRYLD